MKYNHFRKAAQRQIFKKPTGIQIKITEKKKIGKSLEKISKNSVKYNIEKHKDLFNCALSGMVKAIKESSKRREKIEIEKRLKQLEEESKHIKNAIENTNTMDVEEEPKTYKIEKIIAKKKFGKTIKYFVKWEGYSYDECTWEPADNGKNGGIPLDLIDGFKSKSNK